MEEKENMTLKQRFEAFRQKRIQELKNQRALKEQQKEQRREAGFAEALREKFVARAKQYMGVPYARRYHEPGTALYKSPLFLDCCALIRQVVWDLREDFGFTLSRWNQAYQFDVLPDAVPLETLKPGDLVFYSATFYDKRKKPQIHDMVHVEIFLGGPTGEQTIGARWQKGVVQIFDSYKFVSTSYYDIKFHFKSIDTWLAGTCISHCPMHPWRDDRKDVWLPKGSIFIEEEPQEAAEDSEPVDTLFAVGPGNNAELVQEDFLQRGWTMIPASHSFTSKCRFKWTQTHGEIDYSPMHRTLSRQEREASLKRIQANRQLAVSPTAFRQRSVELLHLRERRHSEARLNRTIRIKSQHDSLMKKLLEKKSNFEWRRHKAEIALAARKWVSLAIGMGMSLLLWETIQQRMVTDIQTLHARSRYMLRVLKSASFCIGRIRHRLRTVRTQRAYRSLQRLLPAVRLWLQVRRSLKRSVVVTVLSQRLTEAALQGLLRRWLRAVATIQRAVRASILSTKKANSAAIKLWRSMDPSTVTNAIRMLFIRRFRRKRLLTYCEDYKKRREALANRAQDLVFAHTSATACLEEIMNPLGRTLVLVPRLKTVTDAEMRGILLEYHKACEVAAARNVPLKEVTEEMMCDLLVSVEEPSSPTPAKKKLRRTRTGRPL